MSSFEIAVLVMTVVGNLLLGLLSFLRNPRSATNRIFALLSLAFAAWALVTFFAVNAQTHTTALWATRLVMFLAVPQSVLFMLLMHTFPRSTLAMSRRQLIITSVIAISVGMFTLSPFVFTSVELVAGSAPQPQPGVGMLAFVPLAVGSILAGFYFLIKKSFQSRGLERTQARYLLIGASIMFTLIITFSFIGVAFLQQSSLAAYGPLFTLPFVGLTAYTIIRHRLLDIRAAIFRTMSLLILVGSLLGIYGVLIVFAVPIISDFTAIRGEIIAAIAALIAIPLARFTQTFLTKVTDRFLFQKPIDYQAELARISSDISGTIRIQDVTSIVLRNLTELVRTKKTIIFLQDSSGKYLIPRASNVKQNLNIKIPADHLILRHLHHTGKLIIKDDIKSAIEQQKSAQISQNLQEVNATLTWLDADIILPLIVNKKITGIIIIGPKLTGEPYSKEDINFLKTLAPQAATALENARLYQESLEFGQKLKTEVERATHELSLANEQLRDLDKAKSEFLSIASHQLNTPLTPLRGYLSMLLEGDYGKIPPQQKEIIQRLEKSSVQLISLIKNYLDLSRIESGRLELNLEKLDLAEMTDEIIKELTPNATTKKLAIKFHRPRQALPSVIGDREKLRQVILNLVDNAIKYTTQGGVDVSVNEDDGDVGVAVKDSGRGLEREEITRLFTKFTRVGGKDKYRAEGTGLGLFVAKQIIEEHHGQVSVTSPGKGQGSTFAISLPAANTSRSLKLNN